MLKVVIAAILITSLLSACGDSPATVDSTTDEFGDGIVDILKKPGDQWAAESEKLGKGLDLQVSESGVDEDKLSLNILEVCGNEMLRAFGRG